MAIFAQSLATGAALLAAKAALGGISCSVIPPMNAISVTVRIRRWSTTRSIVRRYASFRQTSSTRPAAGLVAVLWSNFDIVRSGILAFAVCNGTGHLMTILPVVSCAIIQSDTRGYYEFSILKLICQTIHSCKCTGFDI